MSPENALRARIRELERALDEAWHLLRRWNNIHGSVTWSAYEEHEEMRRIRSALAAWQTPGERAIIANRHTDNCPCERCRDLAAEIRAAEQSARREELEQAAAEDYAKRTGVSGWLRARAKEVSGGE